MQVLVRHDTRGKQTKSGSSAMVKKLPAFFSLQLNAFLSQLMHLQPGLRGPQPSQQKPVAVHHALLGARLKSRSARHILNNPCQGSSAANSQGWVNSLSVDMFVNVSQVGLNEVKLATN